MNTISVYAKERGRAPASLPRGGRILEVAFIDVVIPPLAPLAVNLNVRVFILSRRRLRNGLLSEGYEAEPAGITGVITGVRTMELAVTEFIVKNDDPRSSIGFAYLSIQHLHGLTVRLEPWRYALRLFLLPLLPHTRHVPLERDTDVMPRTYVGYDERSRNAIREPEDSESEDQGSDDAE